MPGLHRGGQDFLGIPLVDVHQPYDPLPDASPLSHDAEEEEVDVLGMLAAPSSDDVSIAAMALSRSMTANATRRRQEAQDGYPTRYTLPPPPPPPPADASWFTMFIYKITHSNIYRLITQPSAVIVDLTSRHLQSLQEYSERQRFLSSGASPLGAVSSIFASSTAAKEDSLKKRKSIYHLTEEEDRLARDPDRELSKAVELKPVSMEAVRPARLGDDSDDDDHSMESEYSDNGDDDTAVTDTVDTFDRSGESTRPTQRRRRRRRRVVRGGQGQGKKGVLAYRNPFIDEPRTRGSIHLHSHSRDGSVCPSSEDDMYDDVLEWEDDDIASGYEARTNSVRLMEKGLRNPIPSFALPGDTLSMAKGMNPNYSSHSEPMSMSPPCSPPLSPEDNSYSLYSQKNPGLPHTSNDLAASPPASSVTTHQSLEDDEYNEVGNEARQEDKEYVMDTGLDENTSEDATDHLRIRHHPSFSHAELHEEMPIASSDEPA
ncbi:hypothetical protein BGW41_005495 [Actinomortierella wolfii]|nr:hypothetical protein BGW41_005495 [Actinomortierella wolfii]